MSNSPAAREAYEKQVCICHGGSCKLICHARKQVSPSKRVQALTEVMQQAAEADQQQVGAALATPTAALVISQLQVRHTFLFAAGQQVMWSLLYSQCYVSIRGVTCSRQSSAVCRSLSIDHQSSHRYS